MATFDESLYEAVGKPSYDLNLYDPVESFDTEKFESVQETAASRPEILKGVGETALSLGTGMISGTLESIRRLSPMQQKEILAGLAPKRLDEPGLGELAEASQQKAISDLTYQPKTETGKTLTKYANIPFELLGEGIHWISNQGARGINAVSPMGEQQQEKLAEKLEAGINLGLVMAPVYLRGARPATFRPEEAPKIEPEARSVGAAETPTETTLGEYIDSVGAKFSENISTAASLPKRAAMELAGKSVTEFRQLGEASPSFKKIADLFERPEVIKDKDPATALPYHEAVDLGTGRFMLKLQDTLSRVGNKMTGRISEKTNNELWGKVVNNDFTGELGKPAKELRQILNEFNEYQVKSGMETGYLPKYFPRKYNTKLLKTEAGAGLFLKKMTEAGYDATDASTWLRKIVNEEGILADKGVKRGDPSDPLSFQRAVVEPKIRRQRNAEYSRKLTEISDEELAPLLDRNVYGVLSQYIQHGVRRAEFSRYFGPEGEKVNQLISQGIKELDQAGRPLTHEQLSKLYNILDAEQGLYNATNPLTRKVTQAILSYQYMRTMSLSTLTSLPEPFLLLERGRIDATIKGVIKSLGHVAKEVPRTLFKGLDKAEATRFAEELGLALDVSMVDLLTSLGDVSKTSRITRGFFKANFLSQWTRFERVMASQVGKFHILFNIRDLANGPKGIESLFAKDRMIKRMERELKEIGINPAEAVAWYKKGADQADPFFEKVKAGALDYTHSVIMKPRATNLPLSASSQSFLAKNFWQLKKTQAMIGNTVMKRWWHKLSEYGMYEGARNAGKIAATGMTLVYAHVLLNGIRETIKYGPKGNPKFKDESDLQTITRALDRAGFTGAAQFALDATLAHRFNRSGLAQFSGPLGSQIDEFLDDPKRGVPNAIPVLNVFPGARKEIKESLFGKSERSRMSR